MANVTVLGEKTQFNGTMKFTDTLVITGGFRGTIQATGDLEIASSAIVSTDTIEAKSVVVSGKVAGVITATERLEMNANSVVRGDIQTARLRIDDNASFEGQITMLEPVNDIDLFAVSSKEFKDSLVIKSSSNAPVLS